MHRNKFDEILSKEIRRSKEPTSVQDAVAVLTGKTTFESIPKPTKRYTRKQRAEKVSALKARRNESIDPTDRIEEIDSIPEIEEIDHIDTIDPLSVPDFPEGTIMNDDATLTLPDGRIIQKIQEVSDVEV